ncbi:MAG: glycosyltransferase [Limosilactobacillus reuteri]
MIFLKKGILIVPFMTGKGGTETVIRNLFKAIEDENVFNDCNIIVYSIGGSDDYEWSRPIEHFKVKFISKWRPLRTLYYMTKLPFDIFKIIKSEKPDFIISTNPIMWTLSYYIKRLLSLEIPVISWYHYSLNKKPVKKVLLRSANYYLAISIAIKNELIDNGVSENNIFVVYNPITTDKKIILRPTKETKFIYLGRLDLDGQKNLRDLINACVLLKGQWKISLYGDDKKSEVIKKYASQKGVLSHLDFKGFINNPWGKIDQASALILCSKYEGYPMVLAEAMSHGVFCVASDIEGSNEIINGNNGICYKLGNYNQLAQELQKIIDNTANLPSYTTIQESVKNLLPDCYLKRFQDSIKKIMEK